MVHLCFGLTEYEVTVMAVAAPEVEISQNGEKGGHIYSADECQ